MFSLQSGCNALTDKSFFSGEATLYNLRKAFHTITTFYHTKSQLHWQQIIASECVNPKYLLQQTTQCDQKLKVTTYNRQHFQASCDNFRVYAAV